MSLVSVLLLIAGFILLVLGAEVLVRGASKLALAVGISPLVIGLTVVAYGTSAPEMAVTLMSSLSGQGDLSLGNVVGSNIFNVLFILGLSALIVPLVVSQRLIQIDVPVMIGVSFLPLVLGLDGNIGRLDGLFLFSGAIAYTAFLIIHSKRENKPSQSEDESPQPDSGNRWPLNLLLIGLGLGLLVWGSRWLVDGAVAIAQALGMSQVIIGLTIIAVGTSLPEVATSIIASLKGERDIAVGNVVGSNIFNILSVLGLTGLLSSGGLAVSSEFLSFNLPIMIGVAVACLPIFFTGHVIARWEGALFLGYYLIYTVYLILAATHNAITPVLGAAMVWFVIPLTLITLGVITVRAVRST